MRIGLNNLLNVEYRSPALQVANLAIVSVAGIAVKYVSKSFRGDEREILVTAIRTISFSSTLVIQGLFFKNLRNAMITGAVTNIALASIRNRLLDGNSTSETCLRSTIDFLQLSSTCVIEGLFFKSKNESLSNYINNQLVCVATRVVRFISITPLFANMLSKAVDHLESPEQLGSKLSFLPSYAKSLAKEILCINDGYIRHDGKLYRSNEYGKGIVTPIMEELCDRLVIQECILRQVPKFILQRMSLSPTLMDASIFKVLRIVLSASIFGLSHHHQKVSNIARAMIVGLEYGYLMENVGLAPCIFDHFQWNLMATSRNWGVKSLLPPFLRR